MAHVIATVGGTATVIGTLSDIPNARGWHSKWLEGAMDKMLSKMNRGIIAMPPLWIDHEAPAIGTVTWLSVRGDWLRFAAEIYAGTAGEQIVRDYQGRDVGVSIDAVSNELDGAWSTHVDGRRMHEVVEMCRIHEISLCLRIPPAFSLAYAEIKPIAYLSPSAYRPMARTRSFVYC